MPALHQLSSPTHAGQHALSPSWSFDLTEALDGHPALIVPGLYNSNDSHWQTLWHEQLTSGLRIELDNWDVANLEKWRNAIIAILDNVDEPVVVIAHSFGALASASLAEEYASKIAALFLVAPADPDKFGIREQLPTHRLPVTTKIIASDNDPWISDAKAAYLALQWGTDFLRIKQLGHINSESNIGHWPDGIYELRQLVGKAHKKSLQKSAAYQTV